MDGKPLDLPGIKALSSLPSREVLLAQLLSAMNGVPTAWCGPDVPFPQCPERFAGHQRTKRSGLNRPAVTFQKTGGNAKNGGYYQRRRD
jgi:hypothetical protein